MVTRLFRNLTAFALVSSVALVSSGAHQVLADDEPVDVTIKAWQGRAARVKGLEFVSSGMETQSGRKADSARKISARPGVTFANETRFVIDVQGRVLLDYQGKRWSAERAEYLDSRTFTVFDGRTRTDYFPSGEAFPSAHITQEEASSSTGRHVRTLPIRLVFRPLDGKLGVFDPGKLATTGLKAEVGEARCLILKNGEDQVWVDPARDYIPLRWYQKRGGVTYWFIEIDYELDKEHGWMPIKWKNVALNPAGDILDSVTAIVSNYRINRMVPDKEFRVEFPAGTWVQNYITEERYIVREGGAKRRVAKGEYDGTNYQTILRTEPPGTWSRWWIVVSAALGAAVLFAGLFWLYRRRKSNTKTISPG